MSEKKDNEPDKKKTEGNKEQCGEPEYPGNGNGEAPPEAARAAEEASESLDKVAKAFSAGDEPAGKEPKGGQPDDGETPKDKKSKRKKDDMQAKVNELEIKVEEMRDQALRALAEAENTRKRAQTQVENAQKYGHESFAKDVLAIADNLARALAAVPEEKRDADAEIKNLVEGVGLTMHELDRVLDRHFIKRVEAKGKKLDPNLHQAMFEVETDEAPPGTVVQVMQDGYTIHNRLLRPAMVGVAKAPSKTASPSAGEASKNNGGGGKDKDRDNDGNGDGREDGGS